MWIHLRYRIDTRLEIIKLDSRCFNTAQDVLDKVKHNFTNCIIHLYTDHNIQLKPDDELQKARVYTIRRQPKSL